MSVKAFMDGDFLLHTDTAKELYHGYAADMPIFDFHCHIKVDEIRRDVTYENITQVWLYGDHYKWRAMRLSGIPEHLITGDAPDYEKYLAYARIIPLLIGNPVYHWTHMELKAFFDIDFPLNEESAPAIWEKTREKLQSGFSVRDMITMSKVKAICSTDDPVDSLEDHRAIAEDPSIDFKVLPSFRPDKGVEIGRETFRPWIQKLSEVCGTRIEGYGDFITCLDGRMDFFDSLGCVVSDHGLDTMDYGEYEEGEIEAIFKKGISGEAVTELEVGKYRTAVLAHLADRYHKLGWTMQLHMGAMRNNNRIMKEQLGPDTGFDSIGDGELAAPLSRFLDHTSKKGLPKTILYVLNPKDNYSVATMMGNFPGGSHGTRVQFGSAWWFNDHIDGMLAQLKAFANLGVLPRFVGMLTDSRSFLSYPRHDYFRRILCNFLGDLVERGEYPRDMGTLGKIVQDISYHNANSFISPSSSPR